MKKKVLVVEGDESILQIIYYILTEENFQVITSRTEEGVLERVQREKPDVILLDIINPGPEGTALCYAIKTNLATRHIPVIVLSTHPNIDELKKIFAEGIVSKPFDIIELIEIVEKQIAA